jgi:hypothetical protein
MDLKKRYVYLLGVVKFYNKLNQEIRDANTIDKYRSMLVVNLGWLNFLGWWLYL